MTTIAAALIIAIGLAAAGFLVWGGLSNIADAIDGGTRVRD